MGRRLRRQLHTFRADATGFVFPVPTPAGHLHQSWAFPKPFFGWLRFVRVVLDFPSRRADGTLITASANVPNVRVAMGYVDADQERADIFDVMNLGGQTGGGTQFTAAYTWTSANVTGTPDGVIVTGPLVIGGDLSTRAGALGRVRATAQKSVSFDGLEQPAWVDGMHVILGQAASATDAGPAGPWEVKVAAFFECDECDDSCEAKP